jgi:16S rRNA C1402 N4-methylase RsmH
VLQLVGVDRDPVMLTKARLFLDELSERIEFVQASYAHLEKISEESEIKQFDAILLDL